MSGVGFMEMLLDEVDVEWKPLKEITRVTSNIKWQEESGAFRYIDLSSVDIETKAVTATSEIVSSSAPSRAQKIVEEDDVIFATTRPTQMRYCLIGKEYSGEIASTGYCILRAKKEEVLPKWILHWVGSSSFKLYLEEHQSGSAYPAISDSKVKDFKIPIPCPDNPKKSLEIQAEIVRILDTFTELTAELTAELFARKKQYEHYREQLLSFEEGSVEWKALAEVIKLEKGRQLNKELLSEDGAYPAYNGGISHSGFTDTYNYNENTIIVSQGGASAGFVNFVKSKFYANAHCYVVLPRLEVVENRYVYHFLKLNEDKLTSKRHGAGIPALRKMEILDIQIPIPHIEIQADIVSILDTFTEITAELTAELAARQKQYEYYRELLLSFPVPPSEQKSM